MKIVICFLVLLSLSACDSGTWVDVVVLGDCKNGSPIANPADVKVFGQSWCAQRQKNYTGDFQCKGDQLQVKCK